MNEDTTEVALLKKNVQELQEQLSKQMSELRSFEMKFFHEKENEEREENVIQ